MADLPQTEPGVPAPGIDPTPQEMEQITDVPAIWAWLDSSTALGPALEKALGGTPKLRDVVYIKAAEWDAAVMAMRVPGSTEAESPRPLKAMELGHVAQLRRIARLRLGLTALEAPPRAAGAGSSGDGSATQLAATTTTTPVGGATGALDEPTLKISSVLDPSLDSVLVRLPSAKVRAMFAEYEKARGAEPAEGIEPTVEQVSAVAQVLAADRVPYGDFAILGPNGRRLLNKLMYSAWTFLPNGRWLRQELPGPPSFDLWWSSYRVLRTIFLLLDVVPPETLDNYGELIKDLHDTYGSRCWFIVYQADVRMRSEHMERLRRQAEQGQCLPPKASFDPAKPWYCVFRMAITCTKWWDDNVHKPAFLYLTRCKTAAEVLHDGTSQPDILPAGPAQAAVAAPPPPERPSNFERPRRSRSPKRAPQTTGGSKQQQRDGVFTKKGHRLCDEFNDGSCPYSQATCRDLHACKICRVTGHTWYNCPNGSGSGRKGQRGHDNQDQSQKSRGQDYGKKRR